MGPAMKRMTKLGILFPLKQISKDGIKVSIMFMIFHFKTKFWQANSMIQYYIERLIQQKNVFKILPFQSKMYAKG